jgi:UDP-3-O-[3-hydroxymyristoyl] glucosamine N-acyltransferase
MSIKINLTEELKKLNINFETKKLNILIDKLGLLSSEHDNSLGFIDHKISDKKKLLSSAKIKNIICDFELKNEKSSSNLIFVDNPKLVFSIIGNTFFIKKPNFGIHNSAVIDSKAKIHPRSYIGPNVSVGKSTIGEGAIIYSNVSIYDSVTIGKNCIINSGSVLGSFGFGYNRFKDQSIQFPHLSGLIIKDNFELGSNSSIDRGCLSDTLIGNDCKIDNNVHIGHNVVMNNSIWIAANTCIGGSVNIKDNASIFMGSKIADKVTIGKNSFVGIGSVVISDIPDNKKCFGVPARLIK